MRPPTPPIAIGADPRKSTMKSIKFQWAYLLPLFPVMLGLGMLVFDAKPQQTLRNAIFDQYQRWHPRDYVEAPVRIVDIDEASLARLGQWPWPRTKVAELLDKLGAAGVAVVGFDVLFPEPDRTSPAASVKLWALSGSVRDQLLALPDHDQVFTASLGRTPSVLGFALDQHKDEQANAGPARAPVQKGRFIYAGESQSNWLQTYSHSINSLPALEQMASGNGAVTFVPDADGVVRRVPLVLQIGKQAVGTLSGETLRVALAARNVILKSAGTSIGLAEVRIGNIKIPTNAKGEMWVHYSVSTPQRTVPAWKVLAGQVPQNLLSGHIILIGSSAQGLMDLRFNPFGLIPGVEAHAQALEQALTGHFLVRPNWARGLEAITIMLGGLLLGLLTLRLRALGAAAVWFTLSGGIMGGSWWAFVEHGILLDAATPFIALAATFIISSLSHHFSSEREQAWIKNAFSRYVSPNRVEHLINNHDQLSLGGERKTCSFIFTDLESFTGLIESRDPAQAVALLNDYLDNMIKIIFAHEGTLDRIVGDALAVVFSAPVTQPDHRQRALRCALELDAFANEYSKNQLAKGIPFGKTRIGVHSGEVIVGNFGGSNMFDYRALGDAVNTSARLEAVNKHLGTRMCISEAMVEGEVIVPMRPIGQLLLKGKQKALAVFEPLIEEKFQRAEPTRYAQAYRAMAESSPQAQELFAALMHEWPDDPLVKLHHTRLANGETSDLIVMESK